MNEPISFEPIAMERVWGGASLARFGKKLPPGAPIGEIWEMVDREDVQSVVTSGELEGKTLNDLWRHHREGVFGSAYITHPSERFPILVKLLDAAEKLSVQVHPPSHKALELRGEPKTEVWYFLDCTDDANIYAGLKKGITREAFQKLLKTGGVETALHEIPVRTGESIFIPSGRLHAIGAGNVIIEIQQNSDTTYRVFDWNRTGQEAQILMAKVGLREKPDTKILEIGVGKQQLVEIAKALSKKVKLLILDEPTEHLDADLARRLEISISKWLDHKIAIVITHSGWGDCDKTLTMAR